MGAKGGRKRWASARGTSCYAGLVTPDPEGAKAFYSGLFGWQAEDVPAGEGADDVWRLAERAGGRTLDAPTEIPIGRLALLADPQGAFLVFEGETDP